MKAIVIHRYGGPEVLSLEEVPDPEPGRGEALVELDYAGVNFTDIYARSGIYRHSHTYRNRPPFVPGMEGAGTVREVGAEVSNVAPGDRVAWCLSPGAYAARAVVPAWRLVRVPAGMDLRMATALMLQGCTAHYLTRSLFRLGAGHTCLVHAGAGGVGQLLIQLARLAGARVITTVGSREKAEIVRGLGADHVVLYREQPFTEAVLEITGGRGVDVVYDGVGKATFEGSLRSLARRGTLALFGGASGAVESVTPLDLAEAGSIFLTRPHMADYMCDADEVSWRAGEMLDLAASGGLALRIDRELPLAEAAAAHRVMESRGTTGKLVLALG
ncbi:MAG: quinone oxidoreductase [Gammaproteobacteria bacterium]|nr:quinone oxidoreductase [Gammaproteobacteria bacterium]